MSYETATLIVRCPHCTNEVTIEKRWTPGGVNDYGGWVIQCKCKQHFAVRIGRDVSDSNILSGGTVVAKYDDELKNKQEVLKQYGLKDETA